MGKDRGKVWFGVGCVILNSEGKWLVVKKKYSGLKGVWSIPAGFVQEGEDAETACIREIKEETGINCEVVGLLGLRTGVIQQEISDNMAIFYCKPKNEQQSIQIQEKELEDVQWLTVEEILSSNQSSVLLKELASRLNTKFVIPKIDHINPGDHFQYNSFLLFFHK